jgi:hypothetical protein
LIQKAPVAKNLLANTKEGFLSRSINRNCNGNGTTLNTDNSSPQQAQHPSCTLKFSLRSPRSRRPATHAVGDFSLVYFLLLTPPELQLQVSKSASTGEKNSSCFFLAICRL